MSRSSFSVTMPVSGTGFHSPSPIWSWVFDAGDTTIRIGEDDVDVGHEASVSKIGEEQLFYLMSRGIPEDEAGKLIVNGFIEPIVKELPMEYAVEMNRLIELQMEGSIG